MGCSESTIEKTLEDEKEEKKGKLKIQKSTNSIDLMSYINAEGALNIHSFQSEILISTLKRYSYSKEITECNLIKAFNILGLKIEGFSEFYNQFKEQSTYSKQAVMYNSQKLCCMFILFGRCLTSEKPALLFSLYEELDGKLIKYSEIEKMIQDILWIVLEALPFYAMHKFNESKILAKQIEALCNAKHKLLSVFIRKIIHSSQKSISLKEFSTKLLNPETVVLIKSFDLRKHALESQMFLENQKNFTKSLSTRHSVSGSVGNTSLDEKNNQINRQYTRKSSINSTISKSRTERHCRRSCSSISFNNN
ncbi:hypothetical protein SteCoe_20815 [Stentor coeruleus]|uniref:Uncharacterized protein n=1 Tax=Stentor coeruleus TaxID=5963 RepID=A0A1R2BQX8_9CILI|nr:hypothetical protein SteCoe_20815 [Stentor coeruleus]